MSQTVVDGIKIECLFDKLVELSELKENPKNPMDHPPEQLQMLGKIIKASGWRNPIVVSKKSGFITKGHGRLKAAQLIGMKKVPVNFQNYKSEKEETADIIADNRLNELASKNMNNLAFLLGDLKNGFDVELTGYTNKEFSDILDGWNSDIEKMNGIEASDDPSTALIKVTCKSEKKGHVKEAIETALKHLGDEVTVS